MLDPNTNFPKAQSANFGHYWKVSVGVDIFMFLEYDVKWLKWAEVPTIKKEVAQMNDGLLLSMQVNARNIGKFLNLDPKFTEVIMNEDCVILHQQLKEIIEKQDQRKALVFKQENPNNPNMWTLSLNSLQTERYLLVGLLASAYNALVQPSIDAIQKCLAETLIKIKDGSGLNIVAASTYSSEDGVFCVNIEINDSSPIRICHENPQILMQVISAGLPSVVKKMMSGRR